MNDKQLNELLEYNQEYMDARLSEDVFGGDYTSEVELKYLQKDYDKLQSNWNSLRELIEKEKTRLAKECSHTYEDSLGKTKYVNEDIFNELDKILDKMNELEGVDNENK